MLRLQLCLAFCILSAPLCTSQTVQTYFVTPNASTKCPGDPCYNLATYAQNSEEYFQSYSTFIFLPGVHHLDSMSPAVFQDLQDIHLRASDDFSFVPRTVSNFVRQYGFDSYASDDSINFFESSVQIICDSPSGFAFVNITNLSLHNLTILNCGSTFNLSVEQNCSVYMQDINNLILDGVSIQNGIGYGLMGINILGVSAVARSSFVGNNQYVKNSIQRKLKNGLQCESEGTYYVNNISLPLLGGNAYFKYTRQHPLISVTNQLSFSSCLFALGIEGTLNGKIAPTGAGLTIHMSQSGYYVDVNVSSSTFYRNQAVNYGANLYFILFGETSDVIITNVFSLKGIGYGSGITVFGSEPGQLQFSTSPSFIISNSTFECNTDFGGMSVVFGIDVLITSTSFNSSAALVIGTIAKFWNCNFINSMVTTIQGGFNFYTSCNFLYSPTSYNDASVSYYVGCNLVYSPCTVNYGNCSFNNCALNYSSIDALNSVLSLDGSFSCSHNLRQTNGGCILLYTSTIVFNPGANVTFSRNTAINGGAIYMSGASFLNYTSPLTTRVSFLYNTAYLFGGAIYVDQPYYSNDGTYLYCFYQFIARQSTLAHFRPPPVEYNRLTAVAYVEGNKAGEAGSVLYGGDGYCSQYRSGLETSVDNYIKAGPIELDPRSLIASDPLYVCQCNGTDPSANSCTDTVIRKEVYPGETVQLQLASVDGSYSITPGVVLIFENTTVAGIVFISVIKTSKGCDSYNIPVPYGEGSPSSFDRYFATERAIGTLFQKKFQLSVKVLPCPVGFNIDNKESPSCECQPLLASYGTTCNISDQTILRNGNTWIGYVTNDTTTLGINGQCPYDYCTNGSRVNVSDFDSQCAYNRQKVLCGQCRSGLSMKFGTSQCAKCSHYYLLLVIPFALMGVALVAILFLLNLTVTNGTLSGIIFYANIVRINDTIFFPVTESNRFAQFLSVFIAWLNLDFGIETCFYDGMDSYAKIWLQFAFPIYIFGLVGAIIVAGRFSSKISHLCQYNAVPVLATLVLLSYSKILRATIAIFSFGAIDAGNVTVPLVWLYDGNIKLFEFRHAILFAFGGLITTILIIPYTTILLFLPCLQSKSDWRVLGWVNKLKPFLDSYAGPFKDRYRFWSGVLIFVRLPLYLLFAMSDNQNFRLLGIVTATFLYSQLLCSLAVYKSWNNLLLEVLFIVDLMAITVARLLDPSSDSRLALSAIVQLGVACAFAGFLAIVIAHALVAVRRVKIWHKMSVPDINKATDRVQLEDKPPHVPALPSSMYVYTELREVLLV